MADQRNKGWFATQGTTEFFRERGKISHERVFQKNSAGSVGTSNEHKIPEEDNRQSEVWTP